MAHSGGGPHSSHPQIGAAMAAALAANGMVPPSLPPSSISGFTQAGLPSSSATANAHLLALSQSAGLLQQPPPLSQHMLGIRGMGPGIPVSGHHLNLNHKDDLRRSGERSSSGKKLFTFFKLSGYDFDIKKSLCK